MNRFLTVNELAEGIVVFIGLRRDILTGKLNLHRVAPKFDDENQLIALTQASGLLCEMGTPRKSVWVGEGVL